jgi:dTDP-4-dehydrorhamnose 3,5-epimerase
MIESIRDDKIEGVKIIKRRSFKDHRGDFSVTFNKTLFKSHELPIEFAQSNFTKSVHGSLRGLHIQRNNPQGKLITCHFGRIYDVWVDLRENSSTFKQWSFRSLNAEEFESVYLPPGLAHGFYTQSALAMIGYQCTTPYDAESDGGVNYLDKELKINWPASFDSEPLMTSKDRMLPSVADWLAQK